MAARQPPEIGIEEKLEEGKCGALVVDVVWDILGADVVSLELCVDPGDQPVLRFSAGASSGSESLDSEDVSSSEG